MPYTKPTRGKVITKHAVDTFSRFAHIEASSGIVLLLAALAALIWANSSAADNYAHFWHSPLGITIAGYEFIRPLHFWINDGLMTIFFLVVGMEIRQEIHAGSLSSPRQAALPIAAALGGALIPAAIYLSLNLDSPYRAGWAVPTATDIAFALGLLALLGRGIAHNIRVFLLALAIIDDLIAILIIAFFYSGGLQYEGFAIAALGIMGVLFFQYLGIGNAYAYLLPGALIWCGLLYTGAHPTLAGVVLGLLTPVIAYRPAAQHAKIQRLNQEIEQAPQDLVPALRKLRLAQRELVPPVVRVSSALHPWVAFLIMPIFALSNAGINLSGVGFSLEGTGIITVAIMVALVLGKPLGVMLSSYLMVRTGISQLPAGVDFKGILLIGLFAGIGFTMSLFIAMLAFTADDQLNAAKLGVLLGSLIAALAGLLWGFFYLRTKRV